MLFLRYDLVNVRSVLLTYRHERRRRGYKFQRIRIYSRNVSRFRVVTQVSGSFYPSTSKFRGSVFSYYEFRYSTTYNSCYCCAFAYLLYIVSRLYLVLLCCMRFKVRVITFRIVCFSETRDSRACVGDRVDSVSTFFLCFFGGLFDGIRSYYQYYYKTFILYVGYLVAILVFRFVYGVEQRERFTGLVRSFLGSSFVVRLSRAISLIRRVGGLAFWGAVSGYSLDAQTYLLSKFCRALPSVVLSSLRGRSLSRYSYLFFVSMWPNESCLYVISSRTISLFRVVRGVYRVTVLGTTVFWERVRRSK